MFLSSSECQSGSYPFPILFSLRARDSVLHVQCHVSPSPGEKIFGVTHPNSNISPLKRYLYLENNNLICILGKMSGMRYNYAQKVFRL